MNKAISTVLVDGSHAFEEISSDKTMIDKTVNVVKKASEQIWNIGGYISGAIW